MSTADFSSFSISFPLLDMWIRWVTGMGMSKNQGEYDLAFD